MDLRKSMMQPCSDKNGIVVSICFKKAEKSLHLRSHLVWWTVFMECAISLERIIWKLFECPFFQWNLSSVAKLINRGCCVNVTHQNGVKLVDK